MCILMWKTLLYDVLTCMGLSENCRSWELILVLCRQLILLIKISSLTVSIKAKATKQNPLELPILGRTPGGSWPDLSQGQASRTRLFSAFSLFQMVDLLSWLLTTSFTQGCFSLMPNQSRMPRFFLLPLAMHLRRGLALSSHLAAEDTAKHYCCSPTMKPSWWGWTAEEMQLNVGANLFNTICKCTLIPPF